MARNIEQKEDGKTAWELRKKQPFTGLPLPFGCLVDYIPSPISQDPTGKLESNTRPGVFLGYCLHPGHEWKGEYYVASLSSFAGKDLRQRALPSK